MKPWLISSSASVALPVTVSTTLVLNCAASRGPGTVANCQLLGSLKSNVPFVVTAHCFATLGIAQSSSPGLGVNLGRSRPDLSRREPELYGRRCGGASLCGWRASPCGTPAG